MTRDGRKAALTAAGGSGALHLIKLCVGAAGPEDLIAWHEARAAAAGAAWRPRHTTRMQPKRAEELLQGGSLYWVFRGVIRARQRLLAIEPNEGADGVTRHDLVLERSVVLTAGQPRRPFQGWRYLTGREAPADLSTPSSTEGDRLPPALAEALGQVGVL